MIIIGSFNELRMNKPFFFQDVYEVAKLNPRGRVTSYGAIAAYLGTKSGARMVGWAMNGCPNDVPAHRVLNKAGLLTGKHNFASPDRMQELLNLEGIEVKNNQVLDLKNHFWDPNEEISL